MLTLIMCLSFVAPHVTVNMTDRGDDEKGTVITTLDVCNAAKTFFSASGMPSICNTASEYLVFTSADYFRPDSQRIISSQFTFTIDQPPKSV
ncbi:MAG: hypothetical protein HQL01_14295 [Nitrospirae bacterium]|nr:hypothetical protein [Nitrospirota bacterium]